jgi:hypothetical protein
VPGFGYDYVQNTQVTGPGGVVRESTAFALVDLNNTAAEQVSASHPINPGLQTGPYLVAAGPINQSSGTLAPQFGLPTTAGNLLVCLITDTANCPIVSNPGGWALSAKSGNNAAALWYRPNCGAAESPPTFTDGSGTGAGTAILLEFANITVTSPLEANSSANGATNPQTISNSGSDSQAGELVVVCCGSTGTVQTTGSVAFNNGAQAKMVASNPNHTAGFMFAYGVNTSIPAQDSATATWSSNGTFGMSLATFKFGAAPPPVVTGSVPLAATAGLTVTGAPKFSTLVDDFSSGSLNPAVWNHSASNVSVVSQQLQITNTLSTAEE